MFNYLYKHDKINFICLFFMTMFLIIDLVLLGKDFSLLNGFQVVSIIISITSLYGTLVTYNKNL